MERRGSQRRGRRDCGRPRSSASSLSRGGNATGAARLILALRRPPRHEAAEATSRKQDRRQPLAAVDGRLVGGAPGLEELHQLLARAVVVPFAIALDDLEQIVDRLLAPSLTVQAEREIEPC